MAHDHARNFEAECTGQEPADAEAAYAEGPALARHCRDLLAECACYRAQIGFVEPSSTAMDRARATLRRVMTPDIAPKSATRPAGHRDKGQVGKMRYRATSAIVEGVSK